MNANKKPNILLEFSDQHRAQGGMLEYISPVDSVMSNKKQYIGQE